MKKQKLIQLIFILFSFLPVRLLAQDDITGLWKGVLFDDSTKEYLPYEIVISDDDGKLSGYSYTVFKGERGDEIGVKKLWVKRKKDKIVIDDVDLIADTYMVAVSKKVKKIINLTLTVKDSVMLMSGSWRINFLKEYLPETGKIEIQKKNDNWKKEPLIKKLDEMNLYNDLSFVRMEKRKELLANNNSTEINPVFENREKVTITDKRKKSVVMTKDSSLVAAVVKPSKKEKRTEQASAFSSTKDSSSVTLVKKSKKEKQDEIKNQEAIKNKPIYNEKAAADAYKRKTKTIQSVFFKTDSLVFTLYDNGIVDGDTVSILMNGDLIFAKQGLTEKPISKTIYTKNVPDSSILILYAENLGSIPPNTGLLLIYDGKTRYEIFFSADLDTNAAVILRRKKDG